MVKLSRFGALPKNSIERIYRTKYYSFLKGKSIQKSAKTNELKFNIFATCVKKYEGVFKLQIREIKKYGTIVD